MGTRFSTCSMAELFSGGFHTMINFGKLLARPL